MPYRATARTEEQRLLQRERIVRAARALIARGGFRDASIASVAQAAKVATGSVYRHFESRQALFGEVFEQVARREVMVMRATAAEGSPREALEAAISTFAHRALRSPTLAWALLAEPVDPVIEAQRLRFRRAYRDVLADIIERGMAARVFPAQNASLSAAALVGAIGEALLGPLSPRTKARRAREVSNLVSLCICAVAHKEPRRDRKLRRAA